jgi:hypothetical protein
MNFDPDEPERVLDEILRPDSLSDFAWDVWDDAATLATR